MKKKVILTTGVAIAMASSLFAATPKDQNSTDGKIPVTIKEPCKKGDKNCKSRKQKIYSNPFAEMDARMSQLQTQMDSMFSSPRGGFFYNSSIASPKFQFNTEGKDYVLKLATPGMEKNNLKIELKKDILVISGSYDKKTEKKDGKKVESSSYITSEFVKSFTLPEDADYDKIGDFVAI